jgi:hypothetical protein
VGWAIATRWTGGALKSNGVRRFRFLRPATPPVTGLYYQPGYGFNPASQHSFAGGALLRDDRALYFAPSQPRGLRITRQPGKPRPGPTAVVGRTSYRGRLGAGRAINLDFVIPVVPVDRGSSAYSKIGGGTFDQQRVQVRDRWRRLLGRAMKVTLPESKVVDTFYASLMNLAIARYVADGQWVQAVNKLQYHAFWLRDAAAITSTFDAVGLPDISAEDLAFFMRWQQPDGLFISRTGQYDGFGQALWAFGRHAAMTRDVAFAQGVLPAVGRAMSWLERTRAADPLGLLPPSTPNDNERVNGHLTGDNLWGVAGARAAAALARLAGNTTMADQWSAQAAAYQATLDAEIRQAVRRTGGWIPPALDQRGGQDWGNLWPVYPTGIYPASDRLVQATMRHARSKFAEGIATYRDRTNLHAYLGFRVFQTDLAAGAQMNAIDGLYSSLAHTTTTHGGFEAGVRPWGSRAVDDNMTPHGWFAAEYATMLRDMLVREQPEGGVALMSALSPAWLGPGRTIAVQGAPTTYGPLSFKLRVRRGGARLEWSADVPDGTPLRWPLPAWANHVTATGLESGGRAILLPGKSGAMDVRWRLHPPAASYGRAVAQLQAAYRRRGR